MYQFHLELMSPRVALIKWMRLFYIWWNTNTWDLLSCTKGWFWAFLLMNVLCYSGMCCHEQYDSLSRSWICESSMLRSYWLQCFCFFGNIDSQRSEYCDILHFMSCLALCLVKAKSWIEIHSYTKLWYRVQCDFKT